MKKWYFLLALFCLSPAVWAQTPTDLAFVPKGNICAGLYYNYNWWSKYWEGETLIENGNVGTVGRHTILPAFNIGFHNRINFMGALPYQITTVSQGTLNGQNGLSALMLDVKGKYADLDVGPGRLVIGGDVGFSMPITDYLIDFGPLNLGDGTIRLLYRQLVTYRFDKGFYGHARAAYVYRSNIKDIDRDYYYDDGQSYYTGEVNVPDILEYAFAAGYETNRLLAEVSFQVSNTLGGTDIRRWDPGFPTNNSDAATINGRFDYHFAKPEGLHFTAGAGYTVAGRNTGQSTLLTGGVFYVFRAWGQKDKELELPGQ